MTRTTIDYGIDLGTTNSAVAVLTGTEAEVVKNNEQSDITPSAVYVDKRGRIQVGRKAKDRVERDPDNAVAEFKRRMGLRGQAKTFTNTGRSMEPEELSAEVLKSLREDVRQRRDEDIQAAVITVPAAFELNQTDATRRAAELAGLGFAPLVQEPTAAALAYGFQSEADNQFWLVYDLGGGTFDASIVHLRDGELTVVGHRGDNHLGGQQIDWAIVERLLIPAVTKGRQLDGFARGAKKWQTAVAKLKQAAEEAKVSLSRQDSTTIVFDDEDPLCEDDRGESVEFEYELERGEVERLAEPFYAQSVQICRKALAEAKLAPSMIEKMLLVGGPTLAPHLRGVLDSELGIELDISQDPLTVVARGAAVFAGTQRLPKSNTQRRPGQYGIELEYEPIGADSEPYVGGRVVGDEPGLPSGLTVEFENAEAQPAWRSGKVPVKDNGTFVTQLWAEKGRRNTFTIALADGTGQRLDVTPDHLSYTIGALEDKPLLTHTVGLGLAGNTFMEVLRKGSPLPGRHVIHDLRTTVDVRVGSGTGMIRIPVLEGEYARADRNRRVGTLEVRPADVARDVPAGSEVEVTIEVDASRLVTTTAYVPLLDAEFEKVHDLADVVVPDPAELQGAVQEVRTRHNELVDKVRTNPDLPAQAQLEEIDAGGTLDEIELLVEASAKDDTEEARDAAATAAKRISELQAAHDDVEAALHWPQLVQEAEALLAETREIIDKAGRPDDARRLADLERQTQEAITRRDAHLLERRCSDLQRLGLDVLDRIGQLPIELFEYLKDHLAEMTDIAKAKRLVNEGERALATGEITVLRNVNRQLHQLLPVEAELVDLFSTVRRGDH